MSTDTRGEVNPASGKSDQPWSILSVDDDASYQASLAYSLQRLKVHGRPIRLLSADSAASAVSVLRDNTEVALILLDVVMEDDTAGLRLVNTIRRELSNDTVRIVLLTGQPGIAPRTSTMHDLDIEEYWNKSELTNERLQSTLSGQLRTWEYIRNIELARSNLELIVKAARAISAENHMEGLASRVLDEVSKFIGIREGGVICAIDPTSNRPLDVVAATGCYQDLERTSLDSTHEDIPWGLAQCAIRERQHQFADHYCVFYFSLDNTDSHAYLMLVNKDEHLKEDFQFMLQVFCENVDSSFKKISLLNRLSRLAYYDQDSGLENRNALVRSLEHMKASERDTTVLVNLAITHYDEMMLVFGQDYCQHLFRALHDSLRRILPPSSLFTRPRYHTLAVLMPESELPEALKLEEVTVDIDGTKQALPLRCGILRLRDLAGISAQSLLGLAHAACEAAQHSPRSTIEVDRTLSSRITRQFNLLQELRLAIRNETLSIELQPKVELSAGKTVGFEALARWQTRDGRHIPPVEFIPIAESAGLISSLDLVIFRRVKEALAALLQAGYSLPIALNLSTMDLFNQEVLNALTTFAESGEPGSGLLQVEITESQAGTDFPGFERTLEALSRAGIPVAVDDFGTGYSSLSQVTHMNACALKIDKSFVDDIATRPKAREVIDMIMRLGEGFGFEVIAEGIEEPEQRDYLLRKGCKFGQGYFFARPMKLEALLPWLSTQCSPTDAS